VLRNEAGKRPVSGRIWPISQITRQPLKPSLTCTTLHNAGPSSPAVLLTMSSVHNSSADTNDRQSREIYSVSRLNREVRLLLNSSFPLLWVEGELSNVARPRSGHLYFTLKDADAQVRCAMFRNRNQHLDFTAEDGIKVLVRAHVGLYETRGEFQLSVDHMEPSGSGELQRAFEILKKQLAAEGLFDPQRKRDLPKYPRRLGVITSPTGAAIRDILSVLGRRFPALPVLIYPVPVQGEGAAEAIADALLRADQRKDCDVLVLARGGGSLEDLWAFNEEIVARAIAACQIPVVAGIGHDIDVTIADFAADHRAPTPSVAAELISADQLKLRETLEQTRQDLKRRLTKRLEGLRQTLKWLNGRLQQRHPSHEIQQHSQRLDDLERRLNLATHLGLKSNLQRVSELAHRLQRHSPAAQLAQTAGRHIQLTRRLITAVQHRLIDSRRQLEILTQTLNAVSPLAILGRGYAIVTRDSDQHVVCSHTDVDRGSVVHIRLVQDSLSARITGWEADNCGISERLAPPTDDNP